MGRCGPVRVGGGALLGLAVALLDWSGMFLTGVHGWVGMVMAPLCAVGYCTGQRMHTVKKRRTLLPLAHGLNNLLLAALALWQLWTGITVVRDYLSAPFRPSGTSRPCAAPRWNGRCAGYGTTRRLR